MQHIINLKDFLTESSKEKGTLYSDDNPKDTVGGMHYATEKESEDSIKRLESFYKNKKISHQKSVAIANSMHNRAKHHANPNSGIKASEKIWKEYLDKLKERTKELSEESSVLSFDKFVSEKRGTCWKGYKQVDFKKKNGKIVPNCVRA